MTKVTVGPELVTISTANVPYGSHRILSCSLKYLDNRVRGTFLTCFTDAKTPPEGSWKLRISNINPCCCCCCSVSKWCLTLCDPMDCRHVVPLSFTSSQVCSDSCLLSQWCYPTTSSSATPVSFCPQPFPASGSFPMCGSSHHVANISELQLRH